MSSIHKNSQLIELLKPLLKSHRILIVGASGWIGKNLVELILDLHDNELPSSILLIGKADKEIRIYKNRSVKIHEFNKNLISDFKPTFYINLAFLTREKLQTIKSTEYIEQNRVIINEIEWVASLPTVQYVISTSSGAAEELLSDDQLIKKPYERLKQVEEQKLTQIMENLNKKVLIIRIWSITGKYIKLGDILVIQSLISTLLENRIFKVQSRQEVWRTYINAYEMMGLAMLGILTGRIGIINSGGILVSLRSLVEIAKKAINSHSEIAYTNSFDSKANYYVSKFPDLNQIAKKFDVPLMDLSTQIRETAITIHDNSYE